MSRLEHILRMVVGFFLYWVTAMLMPANWWCGPRGWFFFLLPKIGYYAYHEGKWHEPMSKSNQ